MDQENEKPDAGLRSLDHYKVKLPSWRYRLREALLPIVRWETPYVAWLQNTLRSPALDTYFAMTANLGTHTFFMVMLPVLFWCGYASIGRGMVHVLASGVFISGFIKDMLCLPRPLSPPLQRITMSGSAALEYGFPSTHSTNAISVAIYALWLLKSDDSAQPSTSILMLRGLAYFYGFSIVLGRVYCGMHGFFDVILGGALGAFLGFIQCAYGAQFDTWIHEGDFKQLTIVILIICVLVRIHPEPADDCPCFDDSVSFAGVMIGIQFGGWHFSRTSYSWSDPVPGTVPFNLEQMGWLVAILRIILGVLIIFAWRGVMKRGLLKMLPPIFRIVEDLGLTLPRRFFKPASQYESIPRQRDDDNIIPPAREIPGLLTSMRRRRAISIGPQSEADAYEALAYREKRRRDSINAAVPINKSPSAVEPAYFQQAPAADETRTGNRKRSPSLEQFRAQMGMGSEALSPVAIEGPIPGAPLPPGAENQTDDLQQKELFSNLLKPRVRYDVEVITKIIVYSGIAWLAVEGNPIIFDYVGLSIT